MTTSDGNCGAIMHLKNTTAQEMEQLFPYTPILVGYRGSIAHNMHLPQTDPLSVDDKDVMGVCIAPIECYLGLDQWEGKETFLREWDVVIYEVRKFLRLLEKGNPNVLSLLWLQPNHYLFRKPVGQLIVDHRTLFMTKQLYASFIGYAHGQMKRMTHHATQGYMGAKRKALVERFGFDPKNAAHVVRLLRMGIEALVTGELHVFRHDAPQLLEIKRGEWTLAQVQAEAARLFQRAEAAFDRCTLPTRAHHADVNRLARAILEGHDWSREYHANQDVCAPGGFSNI